MLFTESVITPSCSDMHESRLHAHFLFSSLFPLTTSVTTCHKQHKLPVVVYLLSGGSGPNLHFLSMSLDVTSAYLLYIIYRTVVFYIIIRDKVYNRCGVSVCVAPVWR